eukprot:1284018-Alexandrium_andersonii.AAC.1
MWPYRVLRGLYTYLKGRPSEPADWAPRHPTGVHHSRVEWRGPATAAGIDKSYFQDKVRGRGMRRR